MEKALISVIVPVYNPGDKFRDCLESIDRQNYSNLEIILIDDGSTDGSGNVCDDYASGKKNVKIIHQKNQGASAARNRGIKEATGKYVIFLDADDVIEHDFIDIMVGSIEKENTCLVVCNIKRKIDDLPNTKNMYSGKDFEISNCKKEILKNLLVDGKLYPVVNKIFDAKIIKENNIRFDEKINFSEDLNFVLKYLGNCNGKIVYLSKPLYIYRLDLEKGTVGKSSKEWSNWQKSMVFLNDWVGDNRNLRCRWLLFLIKIRWCVSFLKARRRS